MGAQKCVPFLRKSAENAYRCAEKQPQINRVTLLIIATVLWNPLGQHNENPRLEPLPGIIVMTVIIIITVITVINK